MRHRRTACLLILALGSAAILIALPSSVLVDPSANLQLWHTPQTTHSWTIDLPLLIRPTILPTNASVLVCVTSAPENLDKRQAIRETWGTAPFLKVVFFLGLPHGIRAARQQKVLNAENEAFGDVVQAKFDDDYRNLTIKVIALLLWAADERWPSRRFVIKADDDTFINAPLFLQYMDHFTNGYLYGLYRKSATVTRCNKTRCSKWGLTKSEFAPDNYPPHLQGTLYVFTERALDRVNNHLFDPQYLFVEDVYITGLVAARAGVMRLPMPEGIYINSERPVKSIRSKLKKGLIAQHYCNPNWQRDLWKTVQLQFKP
ncbi:UDP-GlcNAc:betaGal beta-1 [Tropilaelaps mercedesae]|uniref:Hexosyltransferase n=1 Tax=Tropilaelaps mercedesae TaxID=418985 RepID=A0A1V9Y2M6_9ACAR|nr:UDP-GlcNAc:betaGal beta-1 [Tropilaelaps mercedesae]